MTDISKINTDIELPDFIEIGEPCKCGRSDESNPLAGYTILNKITGSRSSVCSVCELESADKKYYNELTRITSHINAHIFLEEQARKENNEKRDEVRKKYGK